MLTAATATAGLYPEERSWRTYRIGGVAVHFPEGYEEYAVYAFRRSRAHLDTLQTWYGGRVPQVDILLNPDWDVNRAHATLFPMRVETPLHPVLSKQLRPQGGYYLDRVLSHELTHTMQLSTTAGITKPLKRVFGEVIAPAGLQPDWALEGQAIITESSNGGGRLNSSFHKMLWRTPMISGTTWRLDQLAVPGRVHPIANRAYVGGSELLDMLWIEQFSREQFKTWLANQAKYPLITGFAFKKAFSGSSPSMKYERLRAQTRSEIRDLMFARKARGFITGDTRLELPRTGWRRPVWTPEGDLVAREESYDRPARLVRTNADVGGIVNKGPNLGYSPDPGVTVFNDGFIVSEVVRDVRAAKKEITRLVYVSEANQHMPINGDSPVRGWSPAWSPMTGSLAWVGPTASGAHALFTGKLTQLADGRVEMVDPDTLFTTALGLITHPVWSPSGKHLAFVADRGKGESVYLLMVETGKLFRIRIKGARCTWDPAFSPRNTLWVSADVDGILDLFEINITDHVAHRRTRVFSGAVEPAVSPDGRQIAYSHYTADGFVLAVLDTGSMAHTKVDFSIDKIDPALFNRADSAFTRAPANAFESYSITSQLLPRFWAPAGKMLYDELTVGGTTYGRDPLGFAEWTAIALTGIETGKPDVTLSGVYHHAFADYSAYMRVYPDDATRYLPARDTTGAVVGVRPDQPYPLRFEGGASLGAPFYLDSGPWNREVNASLGWITRQRYAQYALLDGLEAKRYHGVQLRLNYQSYYGARRDPIPRHILSGGILAEQSLGPISRLHGDLVQASGRFAMPGPADGLVLSAYGTVQAQSGDLEYSRSIVRPRGYTDSNLPDALKRGKMALGGVAFHTPILFPDGGLWYGLLYLERIDGELFVEGATGWGGGRDLSDWLTTNDVGSFGGMLHLGGYVFMDAALRLSLGAAYRTSAEDWGYFMNLGLPNLPGVVYDAWTQDRRPRTFGFE